MPFHPDFLRTLIELSTLAALYLSVIANIIFFMMMLCSRPSLPLLTTQVIASTVFTLGLLAHLNGWWSITHTPRAAWNLGMVLLVGLHIARLFQLPMRQRT